VDPNERSLRRRCKRLIGVARHSETQSLTGLFYVEQRVIAAPLPQSTEPMTWFDLPTEHEAEAIVGDWVHFKGGNYRFLATAREDDSGELLVIYLDAADRVWIRPQHMIDDWIERGAYSGPRFRRLG
jgi:hypothetical protein